MFFFRTNPEWRSRFFMFGLLTFLLYFLFYFCLKQDADKIPIHLNISRGNSQTLLKNSSCAEQMEALDLYIQFWHKHTSKESYFLLPCLFNFDILELIFMNVKNWQTLLEIIYFFINCCRRIFIVLLIVSKVN